MKLLLHAVLVGLIAFPLSSHAAPGDIFVEIMAEPTQPQWLRPGHAFACVVYHLNTGIKEECYGFYPRPGPNDVIVGAPALSGEFRRDPKRFSRISWSFKRQVSSSELQRFFDLVARVEAGSYELFLNNCGDFVHDVVTSIGWKNTYKGLLPEPYVKGVVAANISSFTHSVGDFTRSGSYWTERSATGTYRFLEVRNTNDYINLFDPSRDIAVRLPIRGGMSLVQWRGGSWSNLYTVRPEFY